MRPEKGTTRLASVLLVASALLLCVGCGLHRVGSVFDVWRVEDFSIRSVREDGLVLWGVVSDLPESSSSEQETAYSDLLREELRAGCDGLMVGSPDPLLACLGSDKQTQVTDEYLRDESVSPGTLAEIVECGVDDRYLLIARITVNSVHTDDSSDSPWEGWCTWTTARQAYVALELFDLDAGALVWKAKASDSAENEVSGPEPREKNIAGKVLGFFFGNQSEYPDPPATEDALRKAYARLAEELNRAE